LHKEVCVLFNSDTSQLSTSKKLSTHGPCNQSLICDVSANCNQLLPINTYPLKSIFPSSPITILSQGSKERDADTNEDFAPDKETSPTNGTDEIFVISTRSSVPSKYTSVSSRDEDCA